MLKATKIFSIVCVIILMGLALFCACDLDWSSLDFSFSAKWETSDDGFKYYVDDTIGLCIMSFPDVDEVTIPEYINGMKVVQLGFKDEPSLGFSGDYILSSNIKKLTITHPLNIHGATDNSDTHFPVLEQVTLVDCWSNCNYVEHSANAFRIDFSSADYGHFKSVHPNIRLLKGNKDVIWNQEDVTAIEIPRCVTVIECGVFSNIENVVIKTEWEEQPDGWEDGWNGELEVEWGVAFD